MLSVILPAYNEEQMISLAFQNISTLLIREKIPFEVLFIDDGSQDGTWQQICLTAEANSNVRGIHLSRNFGKEAAMFAGLEMVKGTCCVILDCDLQHPPEKIIEMYRLWEQGYEVVEGIKEDRGDENALHGIAVRTFYSLMSWAMGMDMANSSDFKLLDRKVIDVLIQMPERNMFFRALSYWVGFKTTSVEYRVQERTAGESKWSTYNLIKYALTNIAAFSSLPMQAVTILGCLSLAFSVVLGVFTLFRYFAGTAVTGFTTVILLQLFSASIIMLSLGIIGLYIAKIYEECKRRPKYIISQVCGEGTHEKVY